MAFASTVSRTYGVAVADTGMLVAVGSGVLVAVGSGVLVAVGSGVFVGVGAAVSSCTVTAGDGVGSAGGVASDVGMGVTGIATVVEPGTIRTAPAGGAAGPVPVK